VKRACPLFSLTLPAALSTALLGLILTTTSKSAAAQPNLGSGYTLNNQAAGNAVLVFHRSADGTLTPSGSFATGGTGDGAGNDPLGSQGSVVLDRSNRLLFAVNAGSNDISAFAVNGDGLDLLNTASSGGTRPVSIAVHGNIVYVLNAGGVPNVAGFTIDPRTNELIPLPGSQRGLAGGAAANPAEVSFSATGDILMVTEKGTQTIDTYLVGGDGYLTGPISNHSIGSTPFGFQFSHRLLALVSEAGGTSNALSSYRVAGDGQFSVITGSLKNGQAGVCWAVATADGRYAYTINAGSATVSSYAVSPDGVLSLLDAAAATTGAGSTPTDPALSSDSRLLYVRVGGLGQIQGFRVNEDGSLSPVGAVGGIPPGAQGLAVR
jgi:6-phosphogluconolactonase (cycloisomerase 2 family)